MALEIDDLGLRIIGNNVRHLQWYDNAGQLAAEIYLDDQGRLNVGGSLLVGQGSVSVAGGGGGVGGGGSSSPFPSAASFLTLATDTGLSAERVLTPGSGLAAVDGGAGGAYTLSVDATVVRTTRQVATGTGLTGGGDLGANRTLAIDTAVGLTWTALQTFNAGLAVGGANALTFGGDAALSRTAANVLGLAAGDHLRSSNYASGVSGWGIAADGSAEFENVRIRGELATTVLKFNEMQATAGTLIVSKSAGVINADATTAASIGASFTLNVKDSDAGAALFATSDVLWIKTWTGAAVVSIYATVTAVGSPSGGARNYTCTLNSGSTSTTIRAGTAVADYGPSGTGAITLSADGAVGSSANISIVRHTGSPWSSQTLLARLGNLKDSYGQTLDAHGLGLGDYSGGNYLYYDNLRGFEARFGAGSIGIDANGIRLVKGASSAVGALKFFDSTSFASQVGGLSVDRGTYVDALLYTDASAFDQYARTYLTAIGDTSAANSRRETYLEVNTGAASRWGVVIYGGGTDTLNGGGLQVSATDQGQVGVVPRGEVRAQSALRVGSWSAGVFTEAASLDNSGNLVLTGWVNAAGVAARVRRNADQSVATATVVPIQFDTQTDDDYSMWSSGSNTRLTVPTGKGGRYAIFGGVRWQANATGTRSLTIRLNGTTELMAQGGNGHATDSLPMSVATYYELAAGDYVELIAYQNSGSSLLVTNAPQRGSEFMMFKIT